jgi:hypothetical protein
MFQFNTGMLRYHDDLRFKQNLQSQRVASECPCFGGCLPDCNGYSSGIKYTANQIYVNYKSPPDCC